LNNVGLEQNVTTNNKQTKQQTKQQTNKTKQNKTKQNKTKQNTLLSQLLHRLALAQYPHEPLA
jgi:hypothetical protein